jgi:hypothetical protein
MTTKTRPHVELLAAANRLRGAMSVLNRHGDDVDPRIATQGDNSTVWGPLHTGLANLVSILYPDDGVERRSEKILFVAWQSDLSIEQAARHVADEHAPMSGVSTEDVRVELARYQAYLRAFRDGMLDVVKVTGGTDPAEARDYLTGRIDECLAALKYRGTVARPEAMVLKQWLSERCSNIAERSGSIAHDYEGAIVTARSMARAMDLPWDDQFIPSHVRDLLTPDDDA